MVACAHRVNMRITPSRGGSFHRADGGAMSEGATLIVDPVPRGFQPPSVLVEPGPSPRRWIVGGFRVEWDPRGDMHVEGPPVDDVIDAVLPRRGGWRIITGDAVLDAPSFIGTPWTRQDLDGIGRPGRGAGRVVRIFEGSLRGAPAPTDAPVIDVAFSDELRGLAVLEPGRAYRTDDGGARWLPVDGGVFSGAVATLSGRWLLDRERCAQVLDDGSAREVACDDVPTFRPDSNPLNRLLSPDAWRSPPCATPWDCRPRPASPCPAARHVVPDGSIVLCEAPSDGERANHFDLFDGASGIYRPVLSFWHPHDDAGECSIRADGRAAACLGSCEALPAGDTPRSAVTYCLRLPGGAQVERRIEVGRDDRLVFIGWRGDEPVLAAPSEVRQGARVYERGRSVRSLFGHVAPPMATIRVNRDDLHGVGRDGLLRVRAFDQDWRIPTILEGVPGEGFVARALPPWWSRAQGADAERVVRVCGSDGVLLAASTEDGLWVSERAGAAWRPLFSEGDPTLTRWLRLHRWPVATLDCDEDGVHLPGVGRTLGWGPVAPPLDGAIGLPSAEAPSQRPWPPALTWDCQYSREVASLCAPPSPPPRRVSEARALVGIDRLSLFEGGASPEDEGRLWTLVDATPACPLGAPRGVSGVLVPANDQPLGFVALTHQGPDTLSFLTLVPHDDLVDLTLFEQRGVAPAQRRWHLGVRGTLHSEDRRTTDSIDGITLDRVGTGAFGSVVAASDDARVAASVQLPTWREGRSQRRLLITNRFGEPVRTRALEYAEPLTSGAYVLPESVGVASVARDGSLVGDDLEGRRIRIAPGIRWAPCGAGARGVVVLPTRVDLPGGWDGENLLTDVRAEMGLEGGLLCLRRLVSSRFVHVPGAAPHPTVAFVHSTRRWTWLTCAPR